MLILYVERKNNANKHLLKNLQERQKLSLYRKIFGFLYLLPAGMREIVLPSYYGFNNMK